MRTDSIYHGNTIIIQAPDVARSVTPVMRVHLPPINFVQDSLFILEDVHVSVGVSGTTTQCKVWTALSVAVDV